MNRHKYLQPIIGLVLIVLALIACGGPVTPTPIPPTPTPLPPTATPTPTLTPVPPTPTALPITTNPACGTIVTLVEQGPPPKFGETKIAVELIEYTYLGVVAGGGLVKPEGGSIEKVIIGEKDVALTRNDFNEGYIHTEEFGKIEVLFSASVMGECVLLVATPDQLTKIAEWIP
jgi:hypothetical protein